MGIETAYALAERGLEPTVVEVFDRLLPKQLDDESAHMLQGMLVRRGLRFLLAMQTVSISNEFGKVWLQFQDTTALRVDMAIISAGIRPNIAFLKNSQIDVGRGIRVDTCLQTTIPTIYAAGDCAEFEGRTYGIWPVAKEQGEIAGKALLGQDVKYYGSLMSTRLKVADIELASVGDIAAGPHTKTESQFDGEAFQKRFYENGRLKGAILIGKTKEYFSLQKEISKN